MLRKQREFSSIMKNYLNFIYFINFQLPALKLFESIMLSNMNNKLDDSVFEHCGNKIFGEGFKPMINLKYLIAMVYFINFLKDIVKTNGLV